MTTLLTVVFTLLNSLASLASFYISTITHMIQKNDVLAIEDFSSWPRFGANQLWRYFAINSNNTNVSVNSATAYDNSSACLTDDQQLQFRQDYDPNFDNQYNNVFMIGFQGHQATMKQDLVWNFDFKVAPQVYGSTGFVIEPKGMFGEDGQLALPYTFCGISYCGPENFSSGLRAIHVVDWAPEFIEQIEDIDPFIWNHYEIRLHEQSVEKVLVTIRVNGSFVSEMVVDHWGETEVQIWLDNYKVTLDPDSPMGYTMNYNNKRTPQSVWFDNISLRAEPVF